MKRYTPINPSKALPTMAIALASFMSLPSSAQGAITVIFESLGSKGIWVSFDGSIEIDSRPSDSFTHVILAAYASSGAITTGGGGFKGNWGIVTPSPISNDIENIGDNWNEGKGELNPQFGFQGNGILFSGEHVSGGTESRPTELTVNYLDSFFIIPEATVESLNLGAIHEGTVLWAAGGSATSPENVFVFSSSFALPPVNAMPEPSSALSIGAILGLGLFFRSRR